MANNFNKTINLNLNASTGLKTLDELKLKSEELQATLSTLDVTSIDFKTTKAELDTVNGKLKTFGQTSQEASDIATEAFVKTSQAIVGTTGTLLTFASSSSTADQVTAKLAKTLALVDSIEKIAQATKATSIFLQNKANEATATGIVQAGLFARAQTFLSTTVTGITTAFKNLYVVLLANPFTAVIAVLGIVTASVFAFTKSTQELIDEQQKLYDQTNATNDAIQEYNDVIRESLVLDEKRKNLRKGEELQRRLAIQSITEEQLKADQKILDFEKKVAFERKAIVDSFYFSVFGFTTEQQQKFKEFDTELRNLKTARADLDNKLVDQETKNSEAVNKILNEDTQKQIQLRQSQLANFEDYASKLELISLELQSTLSDIQEREANGDKNTFVDRLIARQNYNNALAKIDKEELARIQAVYDKQVEIDEKFDAKEKSANDKRTADELARQKAIDDDFDKRVAKAEKNKEDQLKAFEALKAKGVETFDALEAKKQEEDLKNLIAGLNASIDALNTFNNVLDKLGLDKGSGLRAINTSLSAILQGFVKISEDGKITFEELTTESLKALSTISVTVNESIQASIEKNIESIDEAINTIEEKRKQVEDDINESLSKQKDLEDKLSEARVNDREKILKAIDAERAREKQLAKDKVKFAEEERKLEEKKKEEKRKAFIANKAASVTQAAIATSVAIITAQAAPPPAGQILAILAGISGALQVASILAQPIPQFRKGGFTSTSNDDSKIAGITHANEYVVSAPIVRSPKFKSVINEIETARKTGSYQSGGFTSPQNDTNDNRFEQILQQTIELSNRPIVVTVVDINNGQQRVAEVIDAATL